MSVSSPGAVFCKGTCDCGEVSWTLAERPESATACNCGICRRYGVLWAYDWDGEGIKTSGRTTVYLRGDREIAFHFCAVCGCVAFWRALTPDDNRWRIAVNLRLTEPEPIADLPIRHFDGLVSCTDLPMDHRRVRDYWG